jgi:hypothetical protein
MPLQISTSDPQWTVDNFEGALVRGVAVFAKAQGITTQTAWTAFRNGLTNAQAVEVVKRILDCVQCLTP